MTISNHLFVNSNTEMGYKMFVPPEYAEQGDDSYPLILFLHGIKKRGTDLSLLDHYGLLKIAEEAKDFPYLVLIPQCPLDTNWSHNRNTVLELLQAVIREFRVDERRIFITGFSMGANGVFDYVANTNQLFAAAVPIAGWCDNGMAKHLLDTSWWLFHGEIDDKVPVSGSESIANAMMNLGGNPRFTRYPDLDHDHKIMHVTYTNPELYEWLNGNKKP
ncbi:dienelactone hydrolase family protein [Paenibacillus sp. TRM 82003]|nr:dienelactone hydrolase family protein [Paenibacillus sp. TRM 82003]